MSGDRDNERVILRARCRRHFLNRIRAVVAFQREAFDESTWDVSDFVRSELYPAVTRWEAIMEQGEDLDFQGETALEIERLMEHTAAPLTPAEVLLRSVSS